MTDPLRSARPARFPDHYGERGGAADVPLEWTLVEARLASAPNYWISTVSPDGRPHTRPVDGVWLEGALLFGGSPETTWVRHLLADPRVSVNLPSTEEVVILEGKAVVVEDPAHPLAEPMAAANVVKYPQYHPDGTAAPFRPFWLVRPDRAYAWRLEDFPNGATRWTFR